MSMRLGRRPRLSAHRLALVAILVDAGMTMAAPSPAVAATPEIERRIAIR